jgi:hypothetical protein
MQEALGVSAGDQEDNREEEAPGVEVPEPRLGLRVEAIVSLAEVGQSLYFLKAADPGDSSSSPFDGSSRVMW